MHDMTVAVLVCFGVWLNLIISIYFKISQASSVHNIKQSRCLLGNSGDFYSNGTNRDQMVFSRKFSQGLKKKQNKKTPQI